MFFPRPGLPAEDQATCSQTILHTDKNFFKGHNFSPKFPNSP